MRLPILVPGLLLAMFSALGQSREEAAIKAVLEQSLKDWNRGDVRAFMESYDDSDETLFIGKAGVTRGHRQVLENYLKRYPNQAAMGETTFSNIQVKLLSPKYAWVLGNWNLKREASAGGEVGGVFTLLLHKTAKGWRIIADHTS
jgi:uncharacterized protein (TIGR02246 family)